MEDPTAFIRELIASLDNTEIKTSLELANSQYQERMAAHNA